MISPVQIYDEINKNQLEFYVAPSSSCDDRLDEILPNIVLRILRAQFIYTKQTPDKCNILNISRLGWASHEREKNKGKIIFFLFENFASIVYSRIAGHRKKGEGHCGFYNYVSLLAWLLVRPPVACIQLYH
jgi:hypothetical protein